MSAFQRKRISRLSRSHERPQPSCRGIASEPSFVEAGDRRSMPFASCPNIADGAILYLLPDQDIRRGRRERRLRHAPFARSNFNAPITTVPAARDHREAPRPDATPAAFRRHGHHFLVRRYAYRQRRLMGIRVSPLPRCLPVRRAIAASLPAYDEDAACRRMI